MQYHSIQYFRSRAIGLNVSGDWICPAKSGEYPNDIPQF